MAAKFSWVMRMRGPKAMPRPRITIRQWMIAVVFIAMGLYSVELGVLTVVAALALAAVRCLVKAPDDSPALRWSASYLVTVACLYWPYAWLLLIDYGWNAYRWFWIAMWPVLPGFTAGMVVHPNETAMRYAMGLATCLLIALFTWLGSFGRRALVASSIVALIGSGLQSGLSYAIYLD